MLIFDSHADTLYAMQDTARDPTLPLDITRKRLTATPDLRVQALALFTGAGGIAKNPGIVERELEMLKGLRVEGFHQITALSQAQPGVPNVLLTIEGGDAFHGGLEKVDAFFALGVRMAAIIWNDPNQLASPAVNGDGKGLTDYGLAVVRRMHALGMAVDISHLNPQGVKDILDLGAAPPLASHSCAYALCPHPRNLTDDQLKALFAAGGYVGVNFYPTFLDTSGKADIDRVIDHLAHICEMGGEKQVGLGSDFDGIETHPVGLRHAGDVPELFKRMEARGFGAALTQDIAGLNAVAYFERVAACAG